MWHAWRVTMHINKGFFPVSLSSKQEVFHLRLSHTAEWVAKNISSLLLEIVSLVIQGTVKKILFLSRSFCLTRNGFVFYRYRWYILFSNVFVLGSGCDWHFLSAVYFLAWSTWLFFATLVNFLLGHGRSVLSNSVKVLNRFPQTKLQRKLNHVFISKDRSAWHFEIRIRLGARNPTAPTIGIGEWEVNVTRFWARFQNVTSVRDRRHIHRFPA